MLFRNKAMLFRCKTMLFLETELLKVYYGHLSQASVAEGGEYP